MSHKGKAVEEQWNRNERRWKSSGTTRRLGAPLALQVTAHLEGTERQRQPERRGQVVARAP